MTVAFVALAALVILGAVMAITGRWDPAILPPERPKAPNLPGGEWSAGDVEGLRFRVGLRGYRMSDVDAALAALAAELRRRDLAAGEQGITTEPASRPED